MIESMKTPLFIRPLTENERSQVLLASERGERAPALASQLGCHRQTVLNIIHGFNTKALAVLQEESSRPHRLRTTFPDEALEDRKSTRLNSSHSQISYAVFCLKK